MMLFLMHYGTFSASIIALPIYIYMYIYLYYDDITYIILNEEYIKNRICCFY